MYYDCTNDKATCTHGLFSEGGTEECDDHDIRLVGGRDEREGTVEVCYDGVWGTICYNWPFGCLEFYTAGLYDVMYNTQADVICKQLGFLKPNTSK